MPNDRPEQPDKPPGESVGGIYRSQVGATSTSSGHVRVRLIQHSPLADPKLVEEVRKFERELKEKEGEEKDYSGPFPEAPLILPVQK